MLHPIAILLTAESMRGLGVDDRREKQEKGLDVDTRETEAGGAPPLRFAMLPLNHIQGYQCGVSGAGLDSFAQRACFVLAFSPEEIKRFVLAFSPEEIKHTPEPSDDAWRVGPMLARQASSTSAQHLRQGTCGDRGELCMKPSAWTRRQARTRDGQGEGGVLKYQLA